MKIAIIPWDESIKKNNIYNKKNDEKSNWHIQFKEYFESNGHVFNTIDCYKDLGEVDWFLFFTLNYGWIKKVIKAGKVTKMVYMSGEPAVVKPENSLEGYQKLLTLFAYIMTWNDELVDDKKIFKRCIPYDFRKEYGNIPFSERKLLTNISGNKTSNHPAELYSERERVVTFFEKNAPQEFDLYGTGWTTAVHPSYLGMAGDKSETYHHYRFALSLENTYGVKGYITEKIFDCLVAGIVPIYQGASNINDYVPLKCYIDYTSFTTLEELREFLLNMDEDTYNGYLAAADELLDTDIQKHFSGELLARQILCMFETGEQRNLMLDTPMKKYIWKAASEENKDRYILAVKLFVKRLIGKA